MVQTNPRFVKTATPTPPDTGEVMKSIAAEAAILADPIPTEDIREIAGDVTQLSGLVAAACRILADHLGEGGDDD